MPAILDQMHFPGLCQSLASEAATKLVKNVRSHPCEYVALAVGSDEEQTLQPCYSGRIDTVAPHYARPSVER